MTQRPADDNAAVHYGAGGTVGGNKGKGHYDLLWPLWCHLASVFSSVSSGAGTT